MTKLKDIETALYESQDYNEYKAAYEEACKHSKNPDEELDMFCVRGERVLTSTRPMSYQIRLPKGTVLRHYTNAEISDETLRSSFRSCDEKLYSDNRIYFFVDDSINSDRVCKYLYEYICTGEEEIWVDQEFESSNRYFGKVFAIFFREEVPFTIKVNRK